ncbi:MAG TPA: hypothetical protein VN878_03525, partial [Usitatibacter sp.]|nr:hypothetical protein [Usitatibacter sp.]
PSPPKKSASEANAPIAPTPSPPERSASETKAPSAAPQAQSAPPPPAPESGAAPLSHASLSDWLWALVALFVALALWLAWRLWRRQPARPQESEYEFAPALSADQIAAASPIFAEEPFEAPEPERRVIASDADLATRIPEDDAGDLRRRYIEERFPEIAKRTITIDDPDSVVKAARLFYEDGALPRAVELLQFAIEQRPGEVKTWLALFEIFRLERLTGQFAELAQRFREHHGKTEYWRKVQYIGREIEPGNSLYVDEAAPGLETIGSGAASGAPAAATFDPVTENWLNAPMDFQNEVLANELRKALMLEASLSEQDLIPNPMPALRNVEMFSVA